MTDTYKYVTDSDWPDIVKLVPVTDTPTDEAATPEGDDATDIAARRIIELEEHVEVTGCDRDAAMVGLANGTNDLTNILVRSGQRKALEVARRYYQRIGAVTELDTTLLAGKLGARKLGDPDRPGLLLGIELEDGTVVHTDSYRIFTDAAIGAHCKWRVPPARGAAYDPTLLFTDPECVLLDQVAPKALVAGDVFIMDAGDLLALSTTAAKLITDGLLDAAGGGKLVAKLERLVAAANASPPAVASFMADPVKGHTVLMFDRIEPHADGERVLFERHDGIVVTVAGRIMASLRGDLVWTQADDVPLGPIQGRAEDGTVVAVVMPIRDGGSLNISDDMRADVAVHLADDCDRLPATARRHLDGAALGAAVGAVRARVVAARQAIGADLEAVRELEKAQRAS